MSKRGQILADELLISCKRYIRFRETGSPDPQDTKGTCHAHEFNCGFCIHCGVRGAQEEPRPGCVVCGGVIVCTEAYCSKHIPAPPRSGGRAQAMEEALNKLLAELSYMQIEAVRDVCGNTNAAVLQLRIDEARSTLAALAPSEEEGTLPEQAQIKRLTAQVLTAENELARVLGLSKEYGEPLVLKGELAEARAAIREAERLLILDRPPGTMSKVDWLALPAVQAARDAS